MKFADWAYAWLLIAISLAAAGGVSVMFWVIRSGLGDVWVGMAWGVTAFSTTLVLIYVTFTLHNP